MNDLVKRLRHAGNDSMNHDCIYTPELIEAADRIERLRAADETYVNVDELLRENKRLFAENKLLETSRDSFRDAYNKMRDGRPVEVRMPDGALDEIVGYGGFHVEMMDKNHWFFDLGGCRFNVFGWDIRLQPIETDCWDNERERVSTEHKQACDRSHDKLKGAYEDLADTEQTDVLPETAIENDSTQNGNYADESQRPRSGSVGDRQ